MRATSFFLAGLLLLFSTLPVRSIAGPTSPIEVEPADDALGETFSPGIRLTAELKKGYVEEEFLISGSSTIYTYENPPVREHPIPLEEDVPYTTRITVIRPKVASHFNGTVVIEWWNSTAGFDTAPVWDASAEYFAREGIVYVGVTNSTTSIDFLKGGCLLLGFIQLAECQTRYATLDMPDNGLAFDMVSQIAHLLRSDAPHNPLPPRFEVDQLFHAGQSQQGGSMVTYATGFHLPDNDGYFIQAAGTARPINFGPECGLPESPLYPDCTPRLQGDQRLVRTDLSVPVVRAQTETDMARVLSGETRQEDSETFRYYEMAGTAHATVHKDVEVVPGLFLEGFCEFPLNTLADGPVFGSFLYNAMWENMQQQVKNGAVPPVGDLIEVVDGEVARDEHGNALGGIRLPQLDVPIATYGPSNVEKATLPALLKPLARLFCILSGTVDDFDPAKLDELYPKVRSYLRPFKERTQQLADEGFLLGPDVAKLIRGAHRTGVGR